MSWMNFDFGAYGVDGNMGMQDIYGMQGRGFSAAQIRQAAQRAPMIYGRAQDWLNANTQAAPWNYGGSGGGQFGMADVNDALMMGNSYKDLQGFADYANANGIGVGSAAQTWLTENADNPAYMSWTDQKAYQEQQIAEQRAYQQQQTAAAEARQKAEWERQQAEHKRMNPKMAASNRAMKAGSAGGVRSKRSSEWEAAGKEGGGNRGTSSLGRGLLIGGLNI